MLIILELEFDLCAIDTASLVDLLNSNFCTMLYSQTINCCTTGYRADATDLNTAPSAAALLSPAAALSPSALLSPAAAAVVDAESEPPHAVKDAAITTAKPALKNLFS